MSNKWKIIYCFQFEPKRSSLTDRKCGMSFLCQFKSFYTRYGIEWFDSVAWQNLENPCYRFDRLIHCSRFWSCDHANKEEVRIKIEKKNTVSFILRGNVYFYVLSKK